MMTPFILLGQQKKEEAESSIAKESQTFCITQEIQRRLFLRKIESFVGSDSGIQGRKRK
jgi:hypothetical protein